MNIDDLKEQEAKAWVEYCDKKAINDEQKTQLDLELAPLTDKWLKLKQRLDDAIKYAEIEAKIRAKIESEKSDVSK